MPTAKEFKGRGANVIGREPVVDTLAINTVLASCGVACIGGLSDCAVKVPALCTAVDFYGAVDKNGSSSWLIESVSCTPDTWVQFPSTCFPHSYVLCKTTGASDDAAPFVAKG